MNSESCNKSIILSRTHKEWVTSRLSLIKNIPDVFHALLSTVIEKQEDLEHEKQLVVQRACFIDNFYKIHNISRDNFSYLEQAKKNGWCERSCLIYYEQFLECAGTEFLKKTFVLTEVHHIIPKYMVSLIYGSNLRQDFLSTLLESKTNLVLLPLASHLDAHAILFIALGFYGDYLAVCLISSREKRATFHSINRIKLGKALGLKYGPKNGLLYGKQGGLTNQSDKTKKILNCKIDWLHSNGTEYLSMPSDSISDLIRQLNSVGPPIRDYSNFRKVLSGKLSSAYGWKIIKIHDYGFT